MEETIEEFQLEAGDEYLKCCGEVLLTLKGHIVFHCNMCEMKYDGFNRYYVHLKDSHSLETYEYLETFHVKTMSNDKRREKMKTTEKNATCVNTCEDKCTEFIEIEPIICNNDMEDDDVEIKHEPLDEDFSIEVLEEDAFLLSDLLTTNSSYSEHRRLNDRVEKKNTVTKASRSKKNVKRTSVSRFMNQVMALSDCSQKVEKSHIAPNKSLNEPMTRSLKDIFSAEIDPDFYHELPPCDRPTLKPSRKPASSLTDEERKHKCPYCPFASKDKTNLWSHIQRHSNNKSHQCAYCPKNFHTRVELTFHTRYHTGERPFLCNECGRSFVTKEQLKQHMKRHNNQRDHECPECGKCFFSSQEVREHMTVHSNSTPFKCDLCQGVFTRKKALTAHKKLHENKRSYKCKLCNASFNQSAGLYLHMKTKHQISKQREVLDASFTFSGNQ